MDLQQEYDRYNQIRALKQLKLEQLMVQLSLGREIKEQMFNFKLTGDQQSEVWTICTILELLLSDQKLYQNNTLKHKLTRSKNGWIPIKDLFQIQTLTQIFSQIQLFQQMTKSQCDKNRLVSFMHNHFYYNNSNLKTNKKFIKRKVPFIDQIKNVKPILIYDFLADQQSDMIKDILKKVSTVYKIKWNLECQNAYVWVQKPQDVIDYFQSLNSFEIQYGPQEQQFIRTKPKVYSYQKLNQLMLNLKFIQQKQITNFLKESFLKKLINKKNQNIAQSVAQINMIERQLINKNLFNPQNIRTYQPQNNNNNGLQGNYIDDDQQLHINRNNRRKANQKINLIMQDIQHFYMPNFNLNHQYLSKIEIEQNKSENNTIMIQNQNLIDSILFQNIHNVIEI